nr:DUF6731 family protein [uncultured Shewanella sp.]
MKIHAFKVNTVNQSVPLQDVLQQIANESIISKRIRSINSSELRAEFVTQDNGLWLIDFVKIRTNHGPGKVGRNTPVEGFNFIQGQGFGEETAALYDPVSGYMLVEYNHNGVRAGLMADYFSYYDQTVANMYSLLAKFDHDVERRLQGKGITKKISYTIDISKMTAQDRQAGLALTSAIEFGTANGAKKITVEISAGGDKRSGLLGRAGDTLAQLKGLVGRDDGSVTSLKVSGKDAADSAPELLDLLGHRLTKEFTDLTLGVDLRYPRDDRFNALKRAMVGWRSVLV